jgi:hypothetical protein
VRLSASYVVPAAQADRPEPVQAAIVWDEPNRLAADFGEHELGSRYLRLRLEDVCADPEGTADRLADFVEGERIWADRVGEIVHTPASLGRWRNEDPGLVAEIAAVAAAGLRRFGYV